MNTIDTLILAVIAHTGVLYILYVFLSQHSTLFITLLVIFLISPLFGISIAILQRVVWSPIAKHFKVRFHSASEVHPMNVYHEPHGAQLNLISSTELDIPDRVLHLYRYCEENLDEV